MSQLASAESWTVPLSMAISLSACRLPSSRSAVKNHAWSVGTRTYPRTVTLPFAPTVNSTSSPSPMCKACLTSSGRRVVPSAEPLREPWFAVVAPACPPDYSSIPPIGAFAEPSA